MLGKLDTLQASEIVIVIRPRIRQYSYGGFMQIKLANCLVYNRHAEDTSLSCNYMHSILHARIDHSGCYQKSQASWVLQNLISVYRDRKWWRITWFASKELYMSGKTLWSITVLRLCLLLVSLYLDSGLVGILLHRKHFRPTTAYIIKLTPCSIT